jgi:hypothetical protein
MDNLHKEDTCNIPETDRDLAQSLQALAEDPDWSLVQSDKTSLWIPIKYAHLSNNHMPINQIICHLQNEFKLKWLRPRVIYHSRHSNLQEKLLGDLKQKLLWGIRNTNFGQWPCYCPKNYKVNGKCAYGSKQSTCRTAGIIYKITCTAPNCNCFYIGKSQRYVKTWIQEHIGEVTKLYSKSILLTSRHQMTATLP